MNENVAKLAITPRGRRVLNALSLMMYSDGVGLARENQYALSNLLQDYWQKPGATQVDINAVLDEPGNKPLPILVGVDQTNGRCVVHVPQDLGDVPVELLELDDPDCPGYDARGLKHPSQESEDLRRDARYVTHDLY